MYERFFKGVQFSYENILTRFSWEVYSFAYPPTVHPPNKIDKAGGLKLNFIADKADTLGVYTPSTALANAKRAPLYACDNSRTVCNYRQSYGHSCQRN